jgi:tetratricopeptide (TPR) repeat protein
MMSMARQMARVAALAALLAAAGGLGGCVRQKGGPAAPVKLPPVSREARNEFEGGVRLWRLGAVDLRLVQARFQRATELDGRFWEAWYNLGLVLAQLGKTQQAEQAFQRVLILSPGSAEATVALADLEERQGRTAQAVQLVRASIAVKDDPQLRKQLVRMLRRSKRYGEAAAEARALLARTPKDIEAYNHLALVYYEQKRLDLAELVLEKALKIDDKDAHSYNNLGLVALARGRDQEAFLHFEKASTLQPRLVRARLNKAVVLLECGEYARALEELQRAVQADAGSLEARVELGVAQRGLKRFTEAAATWEAVLNVDPQHAGALFNLGVLYAEFWKQPDRAKQFLQRFLKVAARSHPKRADADRRLRELKLAGPGKPAAPAAPASPAAPAPQS